MLIFSMLQCSKQKMPSESTPKLISHLDKTNYPFLLAEYDSLDVPVTDRNLCFYSASIYDRDESVANLFPNIEKPPKSALFLRPLNYFSISVPNFSESFSAWNDHDDKRQMITNTAKRLSIYGVGTAIVLSAGAAIITQAPISSTIIGPACQFITSAFGTISSAALGALGYSVTTEFKKNLSSMIARTTEFLKVKVWSNITKGAPQFVQTEWEHNRLKMDADAACQMHLKGMPNNKKERIKILSSEYGVNVMSYNEKNSSALEYLSLMTSSKPILFEVPKDKYLSTLAIIRKMDDEQIEKFQKNSSTNKAAGNSPASGETPPKTCPVTLGDGGKLLVIKQ